MIAVVSRSTSSVVAAGNRGRKKRSYSGWKNRSSRFAVVAACVSAGCSKKRSSSGRKKRSSSGRKKRRSSSRKKRSSSGKKKRSSSGRKKD